MSVKFKKSDFGILINGANQKIRKSSKIRHNGRLFNRPEDIIHYEAIQMLIRDFPDILWSSNILDGVKLGFGVQKKYQGMRNRKGTVDLIILKANAGYFGLAIDFKTDRGKVSKEQVDFISICKINNYYAGVATSTDEAFKIIREYLHSKNTLITRGIE